MRPWPAIPIEVRVRKVVNHLTDGPTTGAVRSVELNFRKIRDGVTKLRRSFRYLRKTERALLRCDRNSEFKRTYRIS